MEDEERPPQDSAPWPIPEGTLVNPQALHDLGEIIALLTSVESGLVELLDSEPVRADPSHPLYVHDLAILVDHLEGIRDKVTELREMAAVQFCRAIPFQTSVVSFGDTRPLIPRFGGDRKGWKNDLLADAVKPRLLQTLDEDLEPTGELRGAQEVLDVTLSVLTLNGSNVKVTGLRKIGLDPDDFCRKVPKDPTVQVVK